MNYFSLSFTLSLLPRYPLEVAHLSGVDGRAGQAEVVHLGGLCVALVVLDEEGEVLDVLELDEAEVDRSAVQLLGGQSGKAIEDSVKKNRERSQ